MRRLLGTIGITAMLTLGAGAASALTYVITVQNDVPGGLDTGQPLTPPVGIVHDSGYSPFTVGMAATPGLELLAEDGLPTVLVGEAMASPDVFDVEVGPGPFVGTSTFEVQGNPGDLFTVVMMFGRTNDIVTGVQAALPGAGSLVLPMTNTYDAGTEVNTGLVEHIPFYGNTMVGPTEGGVVTMIDSYSVLDDATYGQLDYKFPPSATVTIEAVTATSVDSWSWGSVKGAYR
jgi:hypothetical protein